MSSKCDRDKYMHRDDHDLLVELAIRTEGLPEKIADHNERIGKLERDRWWLFTLIGAGWVAIAGVLGRKF